MSADSACLTIDLDVLAANHAALKQAAGGVEVAPVVKADGYGLGADAIALRLWAEGARTFFVARLEEGEALRAALGPDRPATVYVLDGAVTGAARRLLEAKLVPVLNSLAQIEDYAALAHGTRMPAALHADTGMNRLGLRPEELEAMATATDRLDRLDVGLVITHLACGDEAEHPLNARQVGRFRVVRRLFPQARASLANSAGAFLGEDYLFDLVRPGIALYGGGPFGRPDRRIAAVATLAAPILQVRAVTAGETVGYGAAFTAERPMRVAIVAAGYADGLIRASSPGGAVWFEGRRRALLGRVSMDLIAVDVTGCETASPGARVEIFGPNLPVDEAAQAAGTIAYEVLTRVGARVRRVYTGQGG